MTVEPSILGYINLHWRQVVWPKLISIGACRMVQNYLHII